MIINYKLISQAVALISSSLTLMKINIKIKRGNKKKVQASNLRSGKQLVSDSWCIAALIWCVNDCCSRGSV
jgi:hypothetical protein